MFSATSSYAKRTHPLILCKSCTWNADPISSTLHTSLVPSLAVLPVFPTDSPTHCAPQGFVKSCVPTTNSRPSLEQLFSQFCGRSPQDHSPSVWCFLGPVSVIPATSPSAFTEYSPNGTSCFSSSAIWPSLSPQCIPFPPTLTCPRQPSNSPRAPVTSTQASVQSFLPQCSHQLIEIVARSCRPSLTPVQSILLHPCHLSQTHALVKLRGLLSHMAKRALSYLTPLKKWRTAFAAHTLLFWTNTVCVNRFTAFEH